MHLWKYRPRQENNLLVTFTWYCETWSATRLRLAEKWTTILLWEWLSKMFFPEYVFYITFQKALTMLLSICIVRRVKALWEWHCLVSLLSYFPFSAQCIWISYTSVFALTMQCASVHFPTYTPDRVNTLALCFCHFLLLSHHSAWQCNICKWNKLTFEALKWSNHYKKSLMNKYSEFKNEI